MSSASCCLVDVLYTAGELRVCRSRCCGVLVSDGEELWGEESARGRRSREDHSDAERGESPLCGLVYAWIDASWVVTALICSSNFHPAQGLTQPPCSQLSVIIGKLLYAIGAWWGFASAGKHSYNVSSIVAYVLQKHLLSQNLQNLLMANFTNASCTTRTMSYTTCFLNLYITLDKDITIGKASSLVSCTIGILFTVCCLRTAINNVFTYVLLFVLFLRVFVQMRSVILSNKRIW